MNEDQKKAFEDQVNLLPQEYQSIIRSYPWQEKVISIGASQKLYLNQVDELSAEVALVLAGIIGADEFKDELIERLMIEDAKVDELVRALNLEIFNPIQEAIQAKTSTNEGQFVGTQSPTTNGVIKITPEKHSVEPAKKLVKGDPYHEPID